MTNKGSSQGCIAISQKARDIIERSNDKMLKVAR